MVHTRFNVEWRADTSRSSLRWGGTVTRSEKLISMCRTAGGADACCNVRIWLWRAWAQSRPEPRVNSASRHLHRRLGEDAANPGPPGGSTTEPRVHSAAEEGWLPAICTDDSVKTLPTGPPRGTGTPYSTRGYFFSDPRSQYRGNWELQTPSADDSCSRPGFAERSVFRLGHPTALPRLEGKTPSHVSTELCFLPSAPTTRWKCCLREGAPPSHASTRRQRRVGFPPSAPTTR